MRWSVEDKLKFIKLFKQNRTIPIVEGCTSHTMRDRIRRWVNIYNLYGINGIKHRGKTYTYKQKLNVISLIGNGYSYSEIALRHRISTPSTISKWHKLYLKYGPKGLIPKPKGRQERPLIMLSIL